MTADRKIVNKWLITITVMIPTMMEIVDTSVANVALSNIQGSLGAGTEEVTWVLTSYLVANAVILPMTGWLSRLFGRKRFLLTCIALFTLASMLCGAAPNLTTLIIFRVIQGAAGGALIPSSQAILMETFPKKEQGMAMAIFGIGAMTGPVIGPALGGWITDTFSWRWIFYINIPFGILALVMAVFFIFDPEYLKVKKEKKAPIDYWGLALLTLGLGSLQVVLDKGQLEDWFASEFIICFAVISAVSLALLILVELRHKDPIVNLRLFKNLSFSAGNLLMFVFGFCLYGAVMMIPLFLQSLMGYSATMAGMVLAPGGMATLLVMPLVGLGLQRGMDGRKILAAGFTIAGSALFIMQGFTLDASYWAFVWPRIIFGVGLAMIFVPLTTVTLATISKEEMGNATGIFNLMRNIGGGVGIALSATLLARYGQFYQNSLIGHINPFNPVAQQRLSSLAEAALARGGDPVLAEKTALAMLYGQVQQQAGILSFNHIFWILGVCYFCLIPLVLLLKKPSGRQSPSLH